MKYRLIREYPGSPELGNIIDTSELYNVKRYSEFWEKFVEPEYEILSFISDPRVNFLKKGEIMIKGKNNVFSNVSNNIQGGLEEDLLKSIYWNIHSIKRLSDGKIFTVGDLVTSPYMNGTGILKSFKIFKNNICYVVSDAARTFNHTSVGLELLISVKQPLFTTEDGKEIFEGDEYFRVFLKNLDLYETKTIATPGYAFAIMSQSAHHFSTKEKAEEYILMNKPCLSINDLRRIGVDNGIFKEMIIFVNSKNASK